MVPCLYLIPFFKPFNPYGNKRKKLVEISVVGEVASPRSSGHPFRITPEGKPVVLPGLGGITYNVKVGDNAIQWEADHVEPCVTVRNKDVDENGALNLLACIGNTAKIITGDAKGETGIVTGKHGGIENVLADFDDGNAGQASNWGQNTHPGHRRRLCADKVPEHHTPQHVSKPFKGHAHQGR